MRRRLAAVVWAVAAAAALSGCERAAGPGPPAADLPAIDTAAMEPQVAESIEAARRAAAAAPESAAAWGRLGMVCQAHALYQAATACYRRASALDADDYRWPYLAALAQLKYDTTAALASFETAARLSPPNPALFINYGDALLEAGRAEEAADRYRQALELAPRSSHARYGLARVALAGGDAEAARRQLETAAEQAPGHGEVHALLATVYFRLGDAERARRQELRAAAHPDPTRAPDPVVRAMADEEVSSRSYTQRGLRLVREERFQEAEEAFRRVLEIRPGNARDHANLGGALARQGRLDEALAAYREALRVDPDDPFTHNNLALALADRGEVDRAIELLARATELDPTYAEAWLNLGLLRARQGRLEEAVSAYREALQIDPASTAALTNLGTALAAQGRLAAAIEQWQTAVELDALEMSALYNLSVALAGQGRHGEAIGFLRRGLARAPNSSRLVSMLAWELATAPAAELRDGEEAVRLARRVHEAYPDDPGSADVLAAALAETGDFEQAAAVAGRALERARAGGGAEAAEGIRARLEVYRQGRPFRQPR